MQICTSPKTANHTSTSQLSFVQARWISCRQTNSVRPLIDKNLLNHCMTDVPLEVQKWLINDKWYKLHQQRSKTKGSHTPKIVAVAGYYWGI